MRLPIEDRAFLLGGLDVVQEAIWEFHLLHAAGLQSARPLSTSCSTRLRSPTSTRRKNCSAMLPEMATSSPNERRRHDLVLEVGSPALVAPGP